MKDLLGMEIVEEKRLDRDILEHIFSKTLKGIDEQSLISMMYSVYDAILDFSRLCNGEKCGEKITMLFNPHRYSTPTKNGKSIIEGFSTDSFLSGLARVTVFKDGKCRELLYQVLQLGINGVQYVNEFPPYVARDIFKSYSATRILDPCAGWGGRMIGAASVGAFYHGFEPSTKTHAGLVKLGEFLRLFNNGFDFIVDCIPFEDANISGQYDFSLTSPPYYDTEIYSNEDTNSCNRYKTYNEWINGFYLPMIRKTLNSATVFVLNVGSRTYDLKAIIYEHFLGVTELSGKLSGVSGLGRQRDGKESFYVIPRQTGENAPQPIVDNNEGNTK
jgi:hypothetical protein